MVMGFDLTSANVSFELEDIIEEGNIPKIILVSKLVRRQKHRVFKLKRMEIEEEINNKAKEKEKNEAKQYDEFLDELEKDKDLRKQIDLF